MRIGTNHFVSFTKACDYYREQSNEETPAALECLMRAKIDDGDIYIGKSNVPVGGKLILLDNGTRYGIEEA